MISLSCSLCVQSSRNKENTPPLSRSHSSMNLGLQPRTCVPRSLLSSEESLRSLKELWEKLDLALSPSVLSEGNWNQVNHRLAESWHCYFSHAWNGWGHKNLKFTPDISERFLCFIPCVWQPKIWNHSLPVSDHLIPVKKSLQSRAFGLTEEKWAREQGGTHPWTHHKSAQQFGL